MRVKKKLYSKREYKEKIRICRCTHEEDYQGFPINPIDMKTYKTLVPCRVCKCPDYMHMTTKMVVKTL